jgi:Concanavalin A-like lectin/glucanases superfamily
MLNTPLYGARSFVILPLSCRHSGAVGPLLLGLSLLAPVLGCSEDNGNSVGVSGLGPAAGAAGAAAGMSSTAAPAGAAGATPSVAAGGESPSGAVPVANGSPANGSPASGSAGAGAMNAGNPSSDAEQDTAAAEGCVTAPGGALQFNGTLVDLMSGDLGADFPGGDVPRTIEVWAKFLGPQSWTAEHSMIETGLAQGGQNRVLGIDLSGYAGTTAQFGPYTNGYSDSNNPNGVYVPDTPQAGWLHLSWSYTGNRGTLSFTVNGTEFPVATQAGPPSLNFTPGIVTLAASQTFGTQGWTGVLDEVRLWSVAKTPADIQRDMRVVLRGTEPGLVAYYRFDEGSGTFTDDVSGAPSHRLSVCTAPSTRCAAVNAADPVWVESDLPGPFVCAP